jgi:hypothetical protein
MFLAVTIIACGCYWLMLPTLNARRFVEAMRAENYRLADGCFRDPNDRFLVDWNERYWRFQVRANLETWSLGEFIRGKRMVRLSIAYGNAGPLRFDVLNVSVTPTGLHSPQKIGGSIPGGTIDVPLTPSVPTA